MSTSSSPKKPNSIINLKQINKISIKNQSAEEINKNLGNKATYVKLYNKSKSLKVSIDKSHNSSKINLSGKTLVENVGSLDNNSLMNNSSIQQGRKGKCKHALSSGHLNIKNGRNNKYSNNKYMNLCCTHKYSRLCGMIYSSPIKNNKILEENISSCKSTGDLILVDSISPSLNPEEHLIPSQSAAEPKDQCTNSGKLFNSDIDKGDSLIPTPNPNENNNVIKPSSKKPKYLISTISLSIDSHGQKIEHHEQFYSMKDLSTKNLIIDTCVNIHLSEDQINRDNYLYTDYMQDSIDPDNVLGNITEVNETEENDYKELGFGNEPDSNTKERRLEIEDLGILKKDNIIKIPERKSQSCIGLIKIEGNKETKCQFSVQEADSFNLPSKSLFKSRRNKIFNNNQVLNNNKINSLSPRYCLKINYENENIAFKLKSEQFKHGKKKARKRRTIVITNNTYNKSKNNLLLVLEQKLIAESRVNNFKLEKINMIINPENLEDSKIQKEDLNNFIQFIDILKGVYEYDMDINEKVRLFYLCKQDTSLLKELIGNKKEICEENSNIYRKNIHIKGYRNCRSIKTKEQHEITKEKCSFSPYVKQRLHYSMTKEKLKKIEILNDKDQEIVESSNNILKNSQISITKGDNISDKIDSQLSSGEINKIKRNKKINQSDKTNENYLTKLTTFQSTVENDGDKFSKDFFFSTSSNKNLFYRNDEFKIRSEGLDKYPMRSVLTHTIQEDVREKYRNIRLSNFDREKKEGVFKWESKREINKYKGLVYPANDSKYKGSQLITTSSKLFK